MDDCNSDFPDVDFRQKSERLPVISMLGLPFELPFVKDMTASASSQFTSWLLAAFSLAAR